MKIFKILAYTTILSVYFVSLHVVAAEPKQDETTRLSSAWKDKKTAFLGDSITDKRHIGTTKNYWQYMEDILGIKPMVYGINGDTFKGLIKQAKALKEEVGGEVDAIIIFAGTNDYNGGVKIGQWYNYSDAPAPVAGGKTQLRKRREHCLDAGTLKGRINILMSYLKENFPDQQIILLTPIHRGFASFGKNNVQPDESFPNSIGLYIDEYIETIKETASVWAVPVIDLGSISSLYPNTPAHEKFFSFKNTDLLHPNAEGHRRMALALSYMLAAYPPDFKQRP